MINKFFSKNVPFMRSCQKIR